MRQLVLAVVTTVVVVAFGFSNAHEVEVGYVLGEPAEVRLVFLLATAFAAGVLTAIFRGMAAAARRRRKRTRRPVATRRAVARIPETFGLEEAPALRAPRGRRRRRRARTDQVVETRPLLSRLYGIRPRRGRAGLVRRLWHGAVDWVREHDRRVALASLGMTALIVFNVYYYNRLTVLEYDVRKAEANLEASELRRGHIQRNLTRLLRHYAEYESTVMEEITRVRTGTEEGPDGAASAEPSNQDLLGRLEVIAEQYPGLRLTDSTQQLGGAIIAAETDITQRIVEYNEAVNQYTTVLNQFPGNIVGPVLGFESYDFYSPEHGSPTRYEELDL